MEQATDREVLRVTGADRENFLQGLVSNDISAAQQGPVYAALMTPQGKYLADFFILAADGALLIDVSADLADALERRLSLYKLRADVAIERTRMPVWRGLGVPPEGAHPDPRHPALGWRRYGAGAPSGEAADWEAIRVTHCIPESGVELIPNETFILEAGFERLNGVDFHKGCYVGQEVVSRMKRKTALAKGLVTVEVDGAAPVGTPIMSGEREAGTLYTQAHGNGIAFLRFNRAGGAMTAGEARVRWRDG